MADNVIDFKKKKQELETEYYTMDFQGYSEDELIALELSESEIDEIFAQAFMLLSAANDQPAEFMGDEDTYISFEILDEESDDDDYDYDFSFELDDDYHWE